MRNNELCVSTTNYADKRITVLL